MKLKLTARSYGTVSYNFWGRLSFVNCVIEPPVVANYGIYLLKFFKFIATY